MRDREIRTLPIHDLEVRDGGGDAPKIVGHAAVFDRDSEPIMGMFIERVAPGAFARALSEGQDVRALVNHDPNLVLGRTKAGTLELHEDEVGLLAEIQPPDTQPARDLIASIQRGDVDQMSFAFRARKVEWEEAADDGGLDRRTLLDVDLYDVSAVVYPAYPDTDVGVRGDEPAVAEYRAWRESRDAERAKVEKIAAREDEELGRIADEDRRRRLAVATAGIFPATKAGTTD